MDTTTWPRRNIDASMPPRRTAIISSQMDFATPNLDSSMINIQALSEELLLTILHQLLALPKHRRADLLAISKVNRLFGRLAREVLLIQPVVHVLNIHHLVRAYLDYPNLAEKVTKLELLTHIQEGFESKLDPTLWHRRTASCFAPVLDDDFKQACTNIIHDTTIPTPSKVTWIEDLQHDHQNAFFCILFTMLPKLTTLYLGTGSLNHFPFLKDALGVNWTLQCQTTHENMSKELGFPRWTAVYPCEVFQSVSTRLEILELPLSWEDTLQVLQGHKMSLHGCTSLKSLTLSHKALIQFGLLEGRGGGLHSFTHTRNHFLPEGLETLKIIVTADCQTREDYFLHCLSILKRSCASLNKIIFVYYFGLSQSTRLHRRILEYEHGLGLEITHVHQPPWRLHAAMLRVFEGLYSSGIIPSQNDFLVYESRQCYPELLQLRKIEDQENLRKFRGC